MNKEDQKFIKIAIELARTGMLNGDGGPFGAVIVKDSKIIGRGNNCVTSTNDPTAHAEVIAIREACRNISDFQLSGATIYTSCEPCPMCLGAIYWARPDRIVYACNRQDAASIDFDDDYIYKEISLNLEDRSIPTEQVCRKEGLEVFKEWDEWEDKIEY